MSRAMTVGAREWLTTACILALSAGVAIAQEPAGKARGEKPGGAAGRASIYDKTADAKVQVTSSGPKAPTSSADVSSAPVKSSARSLKCCMMLCWTRMRGVAIVAGDGDPSRPRRGRLQH